MYLFPGKFCLDPSNMRNLCSDINIIYIWRKNRMSNLVLYTYIMIRDQPFNSGTYFIMTPKIISVKDFNIFLTQKSYIGSNKFCEITP